VEKLAMTFSKLKMVHMDASFPHFLKLIINSFLCLSMGQIYAECGAKDKFTNIDWARVETNLNNAGAVAKPRDEATGTSLAAAIVGSSGKSAVGAVFLG